MFNLEKSICEWRKQMLAAGIKTPMPLEELEIHLREEIRTRVSKGRSENEAFRLAAARVGTPGSLAVEFKKTRSATNPPEIVGLFILLAVTLPTAIFTGGNWFSGKWSLLVSANVFFSSVGYFAVLLTGGLGIYFVCARFFQVHSSSHEAALNRTAARLNWLSVGLVLAGFVSGMIWSKQNRGSSLADPRAIGMLYVCLWLFASCVAQRLRRMSARITAALCIVGNILVCLAWFGGGMLAHQHQATSYWPLHALIGGHLLFLLISLVPEKITDARNSYV